MITAITTSPKIKHLGYDTFVITKNENNYHLTATNGHKEIQLGVFNTQSLAERIIKRLVDKWSDRVL